jgi:hypothetical protein
MNQVTPSSKRAPRNPNRVDAQLRRRQAEKDAALALETAAAKPTDVVNELQSEAAPAPAARLRNSGEGSERRALGKLRRAFKKAGKAEATEGELRAFLNDLVAAGVPVMRRTSGRLAKVVKGERTVESLLLERGGKKAA